MRIAIDCRIVRGNRDGISRYCLMLLRHLVEADSENTYIVYHLPQSRHLFDEFLHASGRIVLHPLNFPLYTPVEHLVWPFVLRRHGVELIHSPYFTVPLLWHGPSVLTVHDCTFERNADFMPWRQLRPYYRVMMDFAVRRASRVIAISGRTRDDVVNFYPVSRNKLRLVPNGVDARFRPLSTHDVKNWQAPIPLEGRFILHVGVRRPNKNVASLIRAFALLPESVAPQLVLVGDHDHRFTDPVPDVVQSLSLGHRVTDLGPVSDDELVYLYNSAEALVMPSLEEGFGLPALEAMACGLPVVVSRGSAMEELAGNAAILVDPLDSQDIARGLLSLLRDLKLKERCRELGLERARDLSWEQTARRTLDVYREAANV